MPSITEILAQRAAAAKAQASPAPTTLPTVGKSHTAALVLTKTLPPEMANGEPRGQKTPISETPPKAIRRSMSEPEGEAIPLVPLDATPTTTAWHEAMNAFSTEMCLMRDPLNAEYAWLALRLVGQEANPILLYKMPFYEHPRTVRPDSEPF